MSCCRRRQGTGADRYNQGYMEGRMDPERGWEFQAHHRGVNDPVNFKGTKKSGESFFNAIFKDRSFDESYTL
jgi:hypothetical protein